MRTYTSVVVNILEKNKNNYHQNFSGELNIHVNWLTIISPEAHSFSGYFNKKIERYHIFKEWQNNKII